MQRRLCARINNSDILGIPVAAVTQDQVVVSAIHSIKNNNQLAIFAVNPEKILAAQNDSKLKQSLLKAQLLIPDGIGAVWASRLLYGNTIERVAGSDLMPELCRVCADSGYNVFLYGAKPEVNDKAAQQLARLYPDLHIAGRCDGYVRQHEQASLINQINQSGANIVFVALGSPAQEIWINENMHKLTANVFQGVGGTFDVLAGNVKRAPALFIRLNLEWLYRLLKEPTRIRRQLLLPVFVYKVLHEKYKRLQKIE